MGARGFPINPWTGYLYSVAFWSGFVVCCLHRRTSAQVIWLILAFAGLCAPDVILWTGAYRMLTSSSFSHLISLLNPASLGLLVIGLARLFGDIRNILPVADNGLDYPEQVEGEPVK